MKHLSAQDCVAYVRRLAPAEQDFAILEHLRSGCSQCQESIKVWGQIVEFASRKELSARTEAAAEAVVDNAESRMMPTPKLELAFLASDSLRQPVAPGVRSTSASGRQLLYQCGKISVDIRMQSAPGSALVLLIGQLLDSNGPSDRVGEVPVVLLSQGLVVSEKQTSQLGEFDFSFHQLVEGQLIFSLSPKHQLIVPVPDR